MMLLLALLLAFSPVHANAQETAPADAAAAGEEKPAPKRTAAELAASTLAQDIATASYYELIAWCQDLKIDDSGSRQDLMKRLAEHFKVALPVEKKEAEQTIIVRSARESEYYTIEEVDEKYVLLRGDVELEVKDQSDGSVQVIKAATITFNQTRRTMSAEGNVSYSLTRSGQTDTFVGKSLDFNLDTGEAVFYDGSTTRLLKGEQGEIPYSFKGEKITRLANDTVIMKKGSFTSSADPEDPLYQMRAGYVWLLAPSEWAVLNAILYVGRIPVLYLPGFFWPGDDFFFNPNVGYRDREGSFAQTTTYLVGRKTAEDSPFSFLQLSDTGDEGYVLERHGLFLRKMPDTTAPKDDGHTLKLLVDAYSRLGAFVGLQGDFSPLTTFDVGVGLSRTLFETPADYEASTGYTPFLPEATTDYAIGTQFWNSSSFFGLTIPFRFGLEGTFASSADIYSVNASFQYFSDPSFTSDFHTRSETGILSSLLAEEDTTTTTDTTTAKQTSLAWNLAGKLDFSKFFTFPLISTLSLSNINLKMTWLSDTPASLTTIEENDPGSTFFYPSSITAPSVTLALGGDILKLDSTKRRTEQEKEPHEEKAAADAKEPAAGDAASRQAAAPATGEKPPAEEAAENARGANAPAKKAEAEDPGKGIHPPIALAVKPAETAAEAVRIPFREPLLLGNTAARQKAANASSLSVSYQLQPRSTFEHTFDNRAWDTKDDVDYLIRYRIFEAGETSSITTAASLFDSLLTANWSLSTEGLWRSRFDPSAAETASTEWSTLLLSDLEKDKFVLRTAFQSALKPFTAIAELANTSLQYNLGLRLYQIAFAGETVADPVFETTGLEWSSDTVSAHTLQSTLALNNAWTKDSLAISMQLPPLDATYTGRLDASAGIFTGSLQGGFSLPDSGLKYQTVVMTAALNTGSGISASEEVQYDVETSLFTRLTSQVKIWDFSGAYIMQETEDVLQPYSFRIGYESSGEPLWLWKDRVNLDLGVKTYWHYNLQTYTDNLFNFTLNCTLSINKFLDLTLSSVSSNSKTYRYMPGWAEENDTEVMNPLTDLLWSFDFFNTTNRIKSAFKISIFSMKAVQHFNDWDLSLTYSGAPTLRTDEDGKKKYMWTPTFAISVQWKAVSLVKSDIAGTYEGVTLR